MQPHMSSALHGAAAVLTVARTHARVVWPCHCHVFGLISLRAARERLHPRSAIFWAAPRVCPYHTHTRPTWPPSGIKYTCVESVV